MSPSIASLQADFRVARQGLDRRIGEARALALRGQQVEAEVARLQVGIDTYEQVAGLLTKIGEERQDAAQRQIESLVTRGLQMIFDERLSFHLQADVKGKQPVVDFVVRTTLADGRTVDTSVLDARGGGLAAVVGFLLRLVILLLGRGRQRDILVLDETFAHLSAEFEPRMAEFLREVVDKTDVQVLLITHSTAYTDKADKVYQFRLIDGTTHIQEGT